MDPVKYVEQMIAADGEDRFAYENGSPEFIRAVADLEKQFGPIDASGWYSVSTPQYNSIYDDRIVSAIIRSKPAYLDSLDPVSVGRKFFLDKGWVYDKVYTFTTPDSCTLPYPPGALPMFVGQLINVYGQPGDQDLTRYQCLYFMHKDHAQVERWAGKPLPKGKYSTFYAATFDTGRNSELKRMKTYVYDEQGGFSDWDVVWLQMAKKNNYELPNPPA